MPLFFAIGGDSKAGELLVLLVSVLRDIGFDLGRVSECGLALSVSVAPS